MSLNAIQNQISFFADVDGSPLDNGYIYFGVANQNPETNPITVYWDSAGTQPASQPIRTLNGLPSRNGTPAMVYSPSDYSCVVRNKKRALVQSYGGTAGAVISAFMVSVLAAIDAAAARLTLGAAQYGGGDLMATVGGTADALTATFTPNITSLATSVRVLLKGCIANATSTPTFAAGTTTPTAIVKANNQPLAMGDILGDADLEFNLGYGKWVLLNPATGSSSSSIPEKPQCVLSGPVDSNGYAAFGGSVGTATLTTSGTLKATCYAGNGLHYTGSIINPAWTAPGGSGTGYLYLDQVTPGAPTAGVSTLPWIEQYGGTPSTVNGQHTVNTQEGKVYLGNGSTATQVYRNLVGECPFTAGAWSGTIVWYQLKRKYEGVSSSAPSTTRINFNHNLGVKPRNVRMTLVCVAIDVNHAVGQEIEMSGVTSAGQTLVVETSNVDTKTIGVISNTGGLYVYTPTTGVLTAINPAKWNTKVYVEA